MPAKEKTVRRAKVASIWEKPAQYLKGVGPQRARLLARLGIHSVGDLLYHLPRRYEDRTLCRPVKTYGEGETATAEGEVVAVQETRARSGMSVLRVALRDRWGIFYAVWFNQPYVKKVAKVGARLTVTGKVKYGFGVPEIQVAEFEAGEGDEGLSTGRIVPVYPLTEKLSQRMLRTVIFNTLKAEAASCPEILPPDLLASHGLLERGRALCAVHFPESLAEAEEARRRLVFEELFLLQVALLRHRQRVLAVEKEHRCGADGPKVRALREHLPFTLTPAQERAWREIARDMESRYPMQRLLQGDVGSGKTVVAALALAKAAENGLQGALMAPTEILAEQHYLNLRELYAAVGIEAVLLTGSTKKEERLKRLAAVANGEAAVVVGTHALIQEEVSFQRLGLVVIDEQHRFGVRQRGLLQAKGKTPDVLVMTATPIPRTLALTLYGDLDLTVIDALPPGRQPVKTVWLRPAELGRVYRFVRAEVEKGRQAYFVCPLIEESEQLAAQAASKLARELEEIFPAFRIGLLHGRLKLEERDKVMAAFRRNEVQLLVTTTVVEVGVDVPNATVMVILDADRFGLAQLHQLRGRVGRGAHASYCILIAARTTPEAAARLKALTTLADGFALAEEDLRLRGPGEFFGTRQSGLPELKVANILRDHALLELARTEAARYLERDPDLVSPTGQVIKAELEVRFANIKNLKI
ncbi:ATP-dependent DNA helicase RecG [Thermodesulfitimonas autotrophica]|uniref:ATP-dependent DNA helicase RecG n=1 Tax=Thermodesulfitimonas autotrophica TaxID=1894989 RepID=UPI002FDFF809